ERDLRRTPGQAPRSSPWQAPGVLVAPPERLGGELDLLAVDPVGRLLVIEVEPGTSVPGITWAPLQVTFYAELFRKWASEVGDEQAREGLSAMLQQRVALGLTQDPRRSLRQPLDIVPVV